MNRKLNKKNLILSIVAIVVIVVVVLVVIRINNKGSNILDSIIPEEKVATPKITIINPDSNSRPYAVMINNHPTARQHHAGLQDAYLMYEMIVEGGMTRYLAVFKDQNTAKIGSVRSSRPYYLDYALENDAIYVHWGWSPQAESDISTLGINNINGLTWEGTYFYRDTTLNVPLEHTGFTTMEMLQKATKKLNYRSTTDKKALLNYTADIVDLSTKENTTKADTVTITYSNSVTDKYIYDSDNGYYLRYVNNKAHTDDITKEQYHFKNIITYQVSNDTITADEKGRQTLYNTGSGEGYYITNGYAVKIKWEKDSRSSQTKYTYLDGTEIDVSDGNTFIQIQPKGEDLKID